MKHKETTLSSEVIFEGKIIKVTLDKALLENGKTAPREVVRHNGGAGVLALTEEDEVYLVRQFRYPFGEELWELPAGKLEAGEDALEAAKRELLEETGYEAKEMILCVLHLEIKGNVRNIEAMGKVLSTSQIKNSESYEVRVQFEKISNRDRELIIQYIFEDERRRRRQELHRIHILHQGYS